MERDSFQLNFLTERFVVSRWKTDIGKIVKTKIIEAIQASEDIDPILEPYILDHPEIIDPHHYPYYPKSSMRKNYFWVLYSNDLRGIQIYSKDLSNSTSLEKKTLAYSYFNNCDLTNANLNLTDFSFSRFKDCKMDGDLSYGPESPYLRILSTTEAWVGAIFISLYLVVLGKKIFR